MAMTNAQKNGVSEMQAMASLLVSARSKATLLSEIYTNEGLGSLTDGDQCDPGDAGDVRSPCNFMR